MPEALSRTAYTYVCMYVGKYICMGMYEYLNICLHMDDDGVRLGVRLYA